jgi:hypothetical protein
MQLQKWHHARASGVQAHDVEFIETSFSACTILREQQWCLEQPSVSVGTKRLGTNV